ncbi:MAG TPA: multiheme c-type cytochrome [Terriglobales bacterium]|nr:multiheme c-type cytochrome [Terriglobales bacterium]
MDNGFFFPEDDVHQDVSWFLMDVMKVLNYDAVGCSEKELRFGIGYLRAQLRRTQLPMVCANLVFQPPRSKVGRPLLAPSLIKTVGTVKVGVFGLISDNLDLGPSKDSLKVLEPAATARSTIADLRKRGATIVVLLSQLGKIESEDLVTAVDGIDAVIVGHNVALLQKGRMIKNTVACYGGEQGQYVGRTIITLDERRRMATGDNETFMLGPEIPDRKDIASLVKGFTDNFNEKLRKLEKERVAKEAQKQTSATPDHYLGSDVCARCHPTEAAQWKTTGHAQAWQSLVAAHKDATPDCIRCHVVGYNQAGGFKDLTSSPGLPNVQCENCHGMGTQHDAFAAHPRKVTEQTCRSCHTKETSPGFDFALYEPYINHQGVGTKQPLPESPMKRYIGGGK